MTLNKVENKIEKELNIIGRLPFFWNGKKGGEEKEGVKRGGRDFFFFLFGFFGVVWGGKRTRLIQIFFVFFNEIY